MAYRGTTAPIPLGRIGMTGARNPIADSPAALVTAKNISYVDGIIEKEPGATKLNSGALDGPVWGGYDWWPTPTLQRTIVGIDDTSGGSLLRDTGDGSFGTTLKSSLTIDRPVWFQEGGKEVAANNTKLFICTGNDVVQVLSGDGVTTSDLATPPADWATTNQPKCLALHADRLWGAGNANDPHRVYYSSATNHEDFGTGGSISVFSGVGYGGIVRIVSWKNLLIVFKYPEGIFYIDASDPTVSNWQVGKINTHLGTLSTGTVTEGTDELFFVDQSGVIRALSAVDKYTKVDQRGVSDKRNMSYYLRNNGDRSNKDRWSLFWHIYNNELSMIMETFSTEYPVVRVTADFNDSQNPAKFKVCDRDQPLSIWSREDAQRSALAVIGDENGFVWLLEQPGTLVDGSPYSMEIESVPTTLDYIDPRLASLTKNGEHIELDLEVGQETTLQVSVLWDGALGDTFVLDVPPAGDPLGTFVLGSSILRDQGIVTVRSQIKGHGQRVAFKFIHSGTESVGIAGLRMGFNTGNEDVMS